MNITDQETQYDKEYTVEDFIKDKTKILDKGIVATPTENYLESFMKANNGANDILLMQMAKQYGYKLAIKHLKEELTTKN
jgi:methionine synthase II (cobalamin-independent)|tara:strand:- start:1786 stop:2025 length:240 start_codon:yes stop_codon:yes gene_type:complete